jgi:hypothetical protein
VRYAQRKGLSLKVSDEFTVPLCAIHHHHIHSTGKERDWWQERKIDPLSVASRLWQQSRKGHLAALGVDRAEVVEDRADKRTEPGQPSKPEATLSTSSAPNPTRDGNREP